MSGISETDLDLDKLFLPAWAQEKPEKNRFEKHLGDEGERPRRERGRGKFPENRRDAVPRAKSGARANLRRGQESRRHRPEPLPPLPEIAVAFLPGAKGVEHIARQIKMTGRAYPLFQIAHLILQKPERYSVQLAVRKKDGGAIAQPLFHCALDDTPWLSEDEAVAHVLQRHFATFYQTERTPTDPPKGTYTFVAQCGISGVVLGPPNYHGYQNQLRRLHAERFPNMPFDAFKSRVKIVKDEAVVKKWIEEQSFKTEYICLNVPEPLKLPSLEEAAKHFRATHKDAIIKSVETLVVDGVTSRNLPGRELQRLVRVQWDRQRQFPLPVASSLLKQFAGYGLQFFKVNKTVVHVSVARPQYLDLETMPVSENIRRIVEFINANPKCARRKLIETLAPAPTTIELKPEDQGAAGPAPEQTVLIADLHWLIHQGHVLEFADGRLETAKKPSPKPAKAEVKPAEQVESAGETKPSDDSLVEGNDDASSHLADLGRDGLQNRPGSQDETKSQDDKLVEATANEAVQSEFPAAAEHSEGGSLQSEDGTATGTTSAADVSSPS